MSPRRDENDSNFDYVLMKEKDADGMRFYWHKYFTGHMHYYLHLKYQKQLERLVQLGNSVTEGKAAETQSKKEDLKEDSKEEEPILEDLSIPKEELFEMRELEHDIREVTANMRKEMNDLTMRMFLRTTVCFKNIGIFEGKDGTKLYGKDYSGNHIAIFECELKAPPQMALIDHTYAQYIDAYRMNFKNWKIVDIDNFMDGNHFFSTIKEEDVWT